MKVVTSIAKMQELSRQVRGAGLTIGFVPTMGFLHDGHLELVRRARALSDVVVVSIFVNPAQFDRKDDFERYPRDEQADRAMLEHERVDILFMPDAAAVYAPDASTRVHVDGVTEGLCGPRRPGHFDGVTTVVASLFNMIGPDRAWFGEKDRQQLAAVRRMVRDLHVPVEIFGVPTLRERDGLAMSSRNARLSAVERDIAPVVYRALRAAAAAYGAGERSAEMLGRRAAAVLAERAGAVKVEYLELVDGDTMQPTETADERSVLAAAVWLGDVRLIDNVVLAADAGALAREGAHGAHGVHGAACEHGEHGTHPCDAGSAHAHAAPDSAPVSDVSGGDNPHA